LVYRKRKPAHRIKIGNDLWIYNKQDIEVKKKVIKKGILFDIGFYF